MTEIATLRTGAEVPHSVLQTTTTSLCRVWDTNPIAAYELVTLARDPRHQLFGNAAEVLESVGLLHGGVLNATVRDIVLASVDGEGFDACLVNPLGAKVG